MLRALLLLAALGAACGGAGGSATAALSPLPVLPAGFLLGVATAGFQNDPGCPTIPASECIDSHSDWYDFVTAPAIINDPGAYVSGEPLSDSSGSYELYASDFDLVKDQLGGNAVRLSFEWSRLFPQSTALVNDDCDALRAAADATAVAHYHAVLAALKSRSLTPLVTLHHYTLPSWLHDAVGCHQDLATCARRGWLAPQTLLPELVKYAHFSACEYGAEVDYWATLNEPFAVILPGFLYPSANRSNPPAVTLQFDATRAAAAAMIQAHARMYDAVHAADQSDADGDGRASWIGLVYNVTPTAPHDPQNPDDVQGAKDVYYLYNQFFLNAVLTGQVDDNLDGNTRLDPGLLGRMDYLGINYYTRVIVDGLAQPALPQLSPRTRFNPLTLNLWNDYPQGLTDAVMMARSYGVPAIITENGSAEVADAQDLEAGPRFFVQHMMAAQQALAQGGQLRGYFYWTLVDNYEWNHGLAERFGLYQLGTDRAKTRTARSTVATFHQVAAAHGVTPDLQARYPVSSTP